MCLYNPLVFVEISNTGIKYRYPTVTTFGDDLEDPESEWGLLLEVSKWLIESSVVEYSNTTTITPTNTTNTTTTTLDLPLIAVASSGCVLIDVIVAVLYRRMQG